MSDVRRRIKKFFNRGKKATTPAVQRQIVGKDVHGINRDYMSRNAIKVVIQLQEAGFEAYVVGGCVRDALMGLRPKDFDVATSATPEEVRGLFRNSRIIGRRFRLVHVLFGREVIETATFRAPASDQGDDHRTSDTGRVLRDNVYGSLEDDAVRRDFTCNALYYDPIGDEVLDFHDGVADMRGKGGAGDARRCDLQHDIANFQDVTNHQTGTAKVRYQKVFTKEARRGGAR